MDTRELIIQNSFILFLKNGIKEVSINEIIKCCDLSKGAFYHHFESKEQVYMEVLNRFFFFYFKKQNVFYSVDIPLTEKLERFEKSFLDPYEEIAGLLKSDQLTAYFRFLFQAASNYELLRKRVNIHFYRKGYYLYQILETAKEVGEIKADIDSETAARQILTMLIGETILDGIYTIDAIKENIHTVIFNYYSLIKS
jgi:AcrR family transcriptional regulator